MSNIFRKIRESVKLGIWDYIPAVNSIAGKIAFPVSLLSVAAIVRYHGFPQTEQSESIYRFATTFSLVFFSLKYCVLAFFNVHISRFVRQRWVEGLTVLCILIWLVTVRCFRFDFLTYAVGRQNVENLGSITFILIQFYFMCKLKVSDIAGNLFAKIRITPGGLMILSFLILIAFGTLLLLTPEMTTHGISLTDAIFTSTSACCVTGLVSVDTATAFTSKGLFVIMLLIQMGGINIICFASFLSGFYTGMSLRRQSVIREMLNTSLEGTRSLIRDIVIYSLLFELAGAVLIFIYLNITSLYSHSTDENLFLSIFHSISAFNNAGFSFLPDGMMNVLTVNSIYLQTVTIALIFTGGLGFLTIHDIFYVIRKKKRWTQMQPTSRIAVRMSLILILAGAVMFFILEYNAICRDMPLLQRIYVAIFSSVTPRTAGFNTVDFGQIRTATLLLITVFMIIGASPGSTGGGIKVTTFYLLIKTAVATILGKQQVRVLNRAVSFDAVNKSYAALILAIAIVFAGTFLLSLTEPFELKRILFEVASAFGTTGLSTGITGELSTFAKSVIIIIMYMGRITVLTFAFSLTRKVFTRYSLAKTDIGI
ncbi:MAG: hypothetical protein LBG92_03900 [Prevotellaceae bacterium]|jgi:potassium uptake TrkH family protein|nr:hypothetical protein [Prevotellaceae bacterium]